MRARLYTDVVPWLLEHSETFAEAIDAEKSTLSELFDENLEVHTSIHKKRVDNEHARLKKQAEDRAKEEKERLEAKLKRQEERAARKKAEALRRLKQDIKENFIDKGENKEHMTLQEFTDIDGHL